MRTVGLITEYNPFHNGHLYHIRKAREITGADYCVVLMSGTAVQRGEAALFDKYTRARMALLSGADLVLEMPVAFSTASAREFASFGVALLSALGAVDSLVFGSECGELEPLQAAAALLNSETPAFQRRLRQYLRGGATFPQARARALAAESGQTAVPAGPACGRTVSALGGFSPARTVPAPDGSCESGPALAGLLSAPNNILGIEYLRAALALKSPLKFYTIRRQGCGYHDDCLPAEKGRIQNPSASAIRRAVRELYAEEPAAGNPAALEALLAGLVPDAALPALAGAVPLFADDFSSLLNYRILYGDTSGIADLSPDLEARLKKTALPPLSFSRRVLALKTRQLTYTRVSRALLHLIFQVRAAQVESWKDQSYALYARILGFRRESAPLLTALAAHTSIPLVTKMADAAKTLSPSALAMLEQEVRAAHLCAAIRSERGGQFQNEYTQGIITV